MGSLAKRLGQLAARSMESESHRILRTTQANKIPGLSKALDATMSEGHDMKVFGLGTVATLASVDCYTRFTTKMFHVYTAIEEELERATPASAKGCHSFWQAHRHVLARRQALEQDLLDVTAAPFAPADGATKKYVEAIRLCGEADRSGGGGGDMQDGNGCAMLGHVYVRYFADLMGGQVLGTPTRIALGLPCNTPRHYTFAFPARAGDELELFASDRAAYIQSLYASINDAGAEAAAARLQGSEAAAAALDASSLSGHAGDGDGADSGPDVSGVQRAVLAAANDAWKHNIRVYAEEGGGGAMLWLRAFQGGAHLVGRFALQSIGVKGTSTQPTVR